MTAWLVSLVWSEYVKTWLGHRYRVAWEVPLGDRLRLDAALWSRATDNGPMDIALEWEWDNNKVARAFSSGDFRKVLTIDARCGLALVQTRADGKRGSAQADETMHCLRSCAEENRLDDRSVAVIEIRRLCQSSQEVEFSCLLHDIDVGTSRELAHWRYQSSLLMPEISRFFGIVIRMFMEVGGRHHRPHFHAAYQDALATFALDPIECIGGSLPRTQRRLVEAWAEIHYTELLHDWELLQSGKLPIKIEPLR